MTLTLMNAGAGHKIPTGDPDRHFTVEFTVKDGGHQVLAEKSHTMGRWIMWQPAIVELYDNRLLPLASRDYQFAYRMPEASKGLTLTARVRYHILTDGPHEIYEDRIRPDGRRPSIASQSMNEKSHSMKDSRRRLPIRRLSHRHWPV